MASHMIRETFERGQGIFRLMPVFVPRRFAGPAGGCGCTRTTTTPWAPCAARIKERWFSSVIPCMNGPLARPTKA